MLFYTHDRTPKPPPNKRVRLLLFFGWGLMIGMFLLFAIVASIEVQSIQPMLILLLPLTLILWVAEGFYNMEKATVLVDSDQIHVINFCFFKKHKRVFAKQQIVSVEELSGFSFRMRGSRLLFLPYLVFRDARGKFLFKVAAFPNTKAFFEAYLAPTEDTPR